MKRTTPVSRWLAIVGLSAVLALPHGALAQAVEEKPSALAMSADLVLVRPALLGITAVGTAAYIVSFPFSLLGGNTQEAADTLVVKPAEATFIRCLGCTRPGVKPAVQEVRE